MERTTAKMDMAIRISRRVKPFVFVAFIGFFRSIDLLGLGHKMIKPDIILVRPFFAPGDL